MLKVTLFCRRYFCVNFSVGYCSFAPANGRVMIAVKYLLILIPLFCMQFCSGCSHRIGLVTITSLLSIVLRRPTLFVWFPDYKLYRDNVFTLGLLINCLISHWLLINLPAYLYNFHYNFIPTPKPSLAYSIRMNERFQSQKSFRFS